MITPEERAWLENQLSRGHASPALVKKALAALEAAEARAKQAEERLTNALNQNMAGMLEASAEAFAENMQSIIENKKARLGFGFICPYCNQKSKTVEEATAHDAVCEKHPAVMRAKQVERERDALAKILSEGANDCPYLSFWQDSEGKIPAWCEYTDSDEDGFDCAKATDSASCWRLWAAKEAQKQGEGDHD